MRNSQGGRPKPVGAQRSLRFYHMMRACCALMLRDARLKFTRELSDTLTVTSVDTDGLRINGELWSESIALTAEEIIGPWQAPPLDTLAAQHFEALLQYAPELILIGTGAKNTFPPRELMFWFARQGIGLE